MLKNMKIAMKFNLMVMALIFFTILVVSYAEFGRAKASLELARLEQLESIAALKIEKIQALILERKAGLQVVQGYFNIKTNLPIMSHYQTDRSAPIYIEAKKMLDAQLKAFREAHKFLGLML